jgi:poly(beta-D-mannuronate) lyase
MKSIGLGGDLNKAGAEFSSYASCFAALLLAPHSVEPKDEGSMSRIPAHELSTIARAASCRLSATSVRRGNLAPPHFTRGLVNMVLVTFLPLAAAMAAEHRVSSAADIARVVGEAKPGDVLVMTDGGWNDQAIVFNGRGTAEKPITLRAQTPGQVVLAGESSVAIAGEHLVVSGILLQDGRSTGDGVKLAGRDCRLTDSAVVGGSYKFFVHMFGTSNRMDRCYLAGKTNGNPTLQIEVEGRHNYHLIDRNHFGPRPPLGRNGGETMRVGYSHQSMTNSGTVVELNLFDRCDGELEIISSKSCENVYRFNTFLDCAGMLTLRHGNRCIVEGNFFLGHYKRGSGGIRVIGEDHIVFNNYIDGVDKGGFWITSGIPDSELKGYFQARNCVIAFNTFVGSRGPALELDAGIGTSRRTLRPENITIANNLFASSDSAVLKGTEGNGWKWLGNIASAPQVAERDRLRKFDPKLDRAKDGLWRPAADSPVRGVAEGSFPSIRTDMDGQERKGGFDVGSDQISAAPIMLRPLTAADVGPSWTSAAGK